MTTLPSVNTPLVSLVTGRIAIDWYTKFLALPKLRESLSFCLYNNGSVLATGIQGDIVIPYAAKIMRCTLLADQAGDLVLDIWKNVYANYPPTIANTITAAAKPTLVSGLKYQDEALSGWTRDCAEGDILRINIDSVATITRALLILDTVRI